MVLQAARTLTGARPTGFVMAGGRSRRMGRDKALLPWGSGTLLDHALGRLRAVCDRVYILCGSELRYEDRGVPVIVDVLAGAGPLAGVVPALARLADEPGLFLAVDLPEVPETLLADLARRAATADAVVPLWDRGPEPLCAAYTRACLSAAERRLHAGDLKMTAFWPEVRVARVGPPELRRFGDPAVLFRNVNTPSDFDRS